MTFRFANVAGRSALVDADGRWYDLDRLTKGGVPADPMAALDDIDALHSSNERLSLVTPDGDLADAELGPPVPRPRNVFGIGLNYRKHAEETGMDIPTVPLVFGKFPGCISAHGAEIELRAETVDWEVELVVCVGTPGRDIPADRAWEHVLGLTVGQDISDRQLQMSQTPPHFDLGKSRDGYGPIGPVLVSPDGFDDPTDLGLTCSINGELKQDERTTDLIFDVAQLIEHLSGVMTLRRGDLIFTGTPAGVGLPTGTFLQPGDRIDTTVEGIGTLTNVCI